jgi:hypothetical protein
MITFTDYVLQWKPLNVVTLSHIISDNNKQMITLTNYVLGTVEDALPIAIEKMAICISKLETTLAKP